MAVMKLPTGMPAPETLAPTARLAVDARPVIDPLPAVVLPLSITPLAPTRYRGLAPYLVRAADPVIASWMVVPPVLLTVRVLLAPFRTTAALVPPAKMIGLLPEKV